MKPPDQHPSLLKHIRDIIILPITVTVVVPHFIYDPAQTVIPDVLSIKLLGLPFLIAGLYLFINTVYLFGRFGNGTLAPWVPTQRLVVSGPYEYCRNPMITGVFFILTGEALFLHSANILIWAAAFFLINTVYFILKEEPDLYKRFGEEYLHYKAHVPRWIPKLRPYNRNE